jgi:hypothetical protein
MWRTTEEISGDLLSGDPERVAAGLETLDFHLETMEPVAVPPLTADMLNPFGSELPEDVAALFPKLLTRYDGFNPAPTGEEIERELALAAARFGPGRLALEASLVLKTADDPARSVSLALAAIADRGVRPGEVNHAGDFVSYLLAGAPPVRAATVAALASWRDRPDLAAVIKRVDGELDDAELAQVLG